MELEEQLILNTLKAIDAKLDSMRNDQARIEVTQAKIESQMTVFASKYDTLEERHFNLENEFNKFMQRERGHQEERLEHEKAFKTNMQRLSFLVSLIVSIASMIIGYLF